jgi:dTDP-4-dehydrorhamnose reductase
MNSHTHALADLRGQRILITGGGGMLAGSFRRALAADHPAVAVWAPRHAELDVCDESHLARAIEFQPTLILHCAARVDADFCEENPEEAHRSIVGGTRFAIQVARSAGARIVYPQSFLIYDGECETITEATAPQPLSIYGREKLAAERLLLDSAPGALVVRMAGFFGGADVDTNFVGKVVPHLAKLIARGDTRLEIGDRIWQPTYTDDLARNTLLLASRRNEGIYCMACHGEASFHALTVEIARCLGIADRIHIERIDAKVLAGREKAQRPLRAVMDNCRLRDEGLDQQRAWQVALDEYLQHPYFRSFFE